MMIVPINKIKVTARIRKEINNIDELAADIRANGLIAPVAVMPLGGGEYQLLAGFRRIKAAELLGWTELDVNVLSPADAEAALKIEYSENEQREPFTYSEKMEFARLIEEIERVKALKRKSAGGKGGEDVDRGPHLKWGKSRDAVGAKIGMSGKQYDRAKYIAANAPQEIIDELDRGERSVKGTYDELRAKEKVEPLATQTDPPALDDKITELQCQLKEAQARAADAEREIESLQNQLAAGTERESKLQSRLEYINGHAANERRKLDGVIEKLNKQLAEANAKIQEMNREKAIGNWRNHPCLNRGF
jgi:ParB family chromosome partitioning protein